MTADLTYASFDHVSASIHVLEIDGRGRPVYAAVNRHALEEARRPLTDYLGRTALDVYPGPYGRAAYARQCDVARAAEPLRFELSLPIDGTLRTVETLLQPERDARGRVVRLFGTSTDVTAERNARAARAEFDALSAEMEEFVAFAAHDLRAPMRNIAMLAALLRDALPPDAPGALDLADLIETVAAKSMDLIGDVLARAETASAQRHETVFSFPVMCHDISTTLDPRGRHRVQTSLCAVRSDRPAMQIILRNLLENAIKHGQRDQLEIEVTTQPGMPGMLEVTLMDNGRGFSEHDLQVMNGGQFRADCGYGLFGVKRLIAARGGTLMAGNLPEGAGAVVRFSLPGALLGNDPICEELPTLPLGPFAPPDEKPRYSA